MTSRLRAVALPILALLVSFLVVVLVGQIFTGSRDSTSAKNATETVSLTLDVSRDDQASSGSSSTATGSGQGVGPTAQTPQAENLKLCLEPHAKWTLGNDTEWQQEDGERYCHSLTLGTDGPVKVTIQRPGSSGSDS